MNLRAFGRNRSPSWFRPFGFSRDFLCFFLLNYAILSMPS